MKSSPHFFILGYFGWFNVGDDAIGLSVIKELKLRYPSARLTITCNNRYFAENFHGTSLSEDLNIVGFEIFSILRKVIKSDYFIITGGTHLHDADGLTLRRFKILFSLSILTCYARLLSKSPYLLGHGIGPLSSSWSNALVKVILYNSKKIFVRDRDSFVLVTSLGFDEKCIQGFDCAATLINTDPNLRWGGLRYQRKQKIIGISLLPAYSIYSKNVEKDDNIIKSFTSCLNKILEKNNSFNLRFFAFRTGTRHSDIPLLEELKTNINVHPDAIELIQYEGNILKFLNSIDECDFFIGMRYHASVFAYLLQKPQMILDYLGKCKSLGRDIAIDEKAIIPIIDILTPEFCGKIRLFLSSPDQYIANLPVSSAKLRAETMFRKLENELL